MTKRTYLPAGVTPAESMWAAAAKELDRQMAQYYTNTVTNGTATNTTNAFTWTDGLRPVHIHPTEPSSLCRCEFPPDWNGLRHYHSADVHIYPCYCAPGPSIDQVAAFSSHGDRMADHERWRHIKPAVKNLSGYQTIADKQFPPSPYEDKMEPLAWLTHEVDKVCALGRL